MVCLVKLSSKLPARLVYVYACFTVFAFLRTKVRGEEAGWPRLVGTFLFLPVRSLAGKEGGGWTYIDANHTKCCTLIYLPRLAFLHDRPVRVGLSHRSRRSGKGVAPGAVGVSLTGPRWPNTYTHTHTTYIQPFRDKVDYLTTYPATSHYLVDHIYCISKQIKHF